MTDAGETARAAAMEAVTDAVIWAKSEVVVLAPSQVTSSSLLSEPPICLDSLEAIAMVNHLEERFGLIADDERFFAGSVRTVGDVVTAVEDWLAVAEATPGP